MARQCDDDDVESHVASHASAVSLLESGEQRYIKAIMMMMMIVVVVVVVVVLVYLSILCQSLTVSCTETAGLPLHHLSVPHSVLHRDSRSTSPSFVSPSQSLALRQLVRVNLSVTFYQNNVSLSPAFRESVRVQIIVIHSYRDTSPSLSSDSLRVQIIVIHSYRDTSPSLSPAVRA